MHCRELIQRIQLISPFSCWWAVHCFFNQKKNKIKISWLKGCNGVVLPIMGGEEVLDSYWVIEQFKDDKNNA